jgi:hypothetical protein
MSVLRVTFLVVILSLALGCNTPPVDMYFDSSVGADFVAPPRDADADAADGGADATNASQAPSGP